jgi:hypothetical protein
MSVSKPAPFGRLRVRFGAGLHAVIGVAGRRFLTPSGKHDISEYQRPGVQRTNGGLDVHRGDVRAKK